MVQNGAYKKAAMALERSGPQLSDDANRRWGVLLHPESTDGRRALSTYELKKVRKQERKLKAKAAAEAAAALLAQEQGKGKGGGNPPSRQPPGASPIQVPHGAEGGGASPPLRVRVRRGMMAPMVTL